MNFESHEDCLKILEEICWQGKPQCPYCGSSKSSKMKSEKRYHCQKCFTSFSVTVRTIFHKTSIDLRKWFIAIPLVLEEEISVRKLARKIDVNPNTSHRMIQKIMQEQDSVIVQTILNQSK